MNEPDSDLPYFFHSLPNVIDLFAAELSRMQSNAFDDSISKGIKAADGLIPDYADPSGRDFIRLHGRIEIYPDGSKAFFWRGKLVVKQWPPKIF